MDCSIDGCQRKGIAKQLCLMHYKRKWRYGDPLKRLRRANGEGGTFIGYRTITINGKTVLEHRHIMEQRLGRKLEPHEQVHHIDEDRMNNDPSNLLLTQRGEHQALHRKYRATTTHKECRACRRFMSRSYFVPIPQKSITRWNDPHNTECRECLRERARKWKKKVGYNVSPQLRVASKCRYWRQKFHERVNEDLLKDLARIVKLSHEKA